MDDGFDERGGELMLASGCPDDVTVVLTDAFDTLERIRLPTAGMHHVEAFGVLEPETGEEGLSEAELLRIRVF